jgi:hypothetical protein
VELDCIAALGSTVTSSVVPAAVSVYDNLHVLNRLTFYSTSTVTTISPLSFTTFPFSVKPFTKTITFTNTDIISTETDTTITSYVITQSTTLITVSESTSYYFQTDTSPSVIQKRAAPTVPAYAKACPNYDSFMSGCGCLGIGPKHVTKTAATPTIFITVVSTKVLPSTIVIVSSSTSTEIDSATISITATSTSTDTLYRATLTSATSTTSLTVVETATSFYLQLSNSGNALYAAGNGGSDAPSEQSFVTSKLYLPTKCSIASNGYVICEGLYLSQQNGPYGQNLLDLLSASAYSRNQAILNHLICSIDQSDEFSCAPNDGNSVFFTDTYNIYYAAPGFLCNGAAVCSQVSLTAKPSFS